jgi:hypothetical protein
VFRLKSGCARTESAHRLVHAHRFGLGAHEWYPCVRPLSERRNQQFDPSQLYASGCG